MTPTMALVVRRDEEISKFKPVTHYAIKVIFENELGEIPTTWQMSDKVPNLKTLPNEEFSEVVKMADTSIHSRTWNDKKISAHHAIIPTRIKADFANLNEVEKNLYLLVARTYLAQFYQVHEYKSTKVIISYTDEKFVGKGKNVTQLGWKVLYKNFEREESEETESVLPQVQEGETVKYVSGKVVEKVTKPPKKFTPSTLLQAMKEIFKYVKNDKLKAELKECSGIGTGATRAGIIEKLQTAGFLKLAGKFFEPTEKAKMAVKILPEELIYPDTTAILEKYKEEYRQKKLLEQDKINPELEYLKQTY